LLLALSVLTVLPLVPALAASYLLDDARLTSALNYAEWSPLAAVIYVIAVALELAGLRWLVLGRVREGRYRIASGFYLRKWFVEQLNELSLAILHPLYASLYLPPYFRLLGAKIGARAEISTASSVTYDLLEVGDEAFVADAVTLGDPVTRRGWLSLNRTRLGRRAFIGNGAHVPDGAAIPDDVLIGCLSLAPGSDVIPEKSTFLGIPARRLPRREAFNTFPENLTYRPRRARVAARLIVEGLRIVMPVAVVLSLVFAFLSAEWDLLHRVHPVAAVAAVPLLYVAILGLPATLVSLLFKWVLIGRYRERTVPMWASFVWLSEAVTTTYETLAVPCFLHHLQGTPLLPFFLRLFGAKIGARAYLDTTDMTEFDLNDVGDEAALNFDCGLQTHLFEDRVMKIRSVSVGRRAVIGCNSIALPGSRIGADAKLGALSLVMKGERLPAGTAWHGAPARPA
jgi:non-ribosomal peptide synthetase-like protein